MPGLLWSCKVRGEGPARLRQAGIRPDRAGSLAHRGAKHNRAPCRTGRREGRRPTKLIWAFQPFMQAGHPILCGAARFRHDQFRQARGRLRAEYADDEELRFKATARRNKLIGLWAAEKLGLSGDAAEQYARDLVVGDFARRDPELLAKLLHDFDAHGITVSEHQVRKEVAGIHGTGDRPSQIGVARLSVWAAAGISSRAVGCRLAATRSSTVPRPALTSLTPMPRTR